jgi:phosphatidylglycerol:prolipoprotein diacylglycerol transferase
VFPIFFHVGPVTLHTYGLMVALGFLLAYQIARIEFKRLGLFDPGPASANTRLEVTVWYIMIGALIGARAAYMALNGREEFFANPLSFFRVWEGGLVFYGGAIGGFLGLLIASRRWPGTLLKMTDAFAAPLLLGQAVGRLGCLAAGCCYGRPTDKPWGVTFTNPDALGPLYEKLHPTQAYESLGAFVLCALALLISRRFPRIGLATVFYCIAYGIMRFFVEVWRGDDRGAFSVHLSPSQSGSLILIGIGIAVATRVFLREKTHA